MTTPEQRREDRRAAVRVAVTWLAAIFLFGGGAATAAAFYIAGEYQAAKDIFLSVSAVGASITAYWFAGRAQERALAVYPASPPAAAETRPQPRKDKNE